MQLRLGGCRPIALGSAPRQLWAWGRVSGAMRCFSGGSLREGRVSNEQVRKHPGKETEAVNMLAEGTAQELDGQPSPGRAREHRVRKILEIVTSEPPRTVRDLAGQIHLSHSYVQHIFKRQTGARLGQLMVRRR